MDSFLKSLSLSFLLRSAFAGAYFLVAFRAPGQVAFFPANEQITNAVPYLSLVALISGVTAYALHRAVVYPAISWLLRMADSKPNDYGSWLISKEETDELLRRWQPQTLPSHFADWSDNIHYLFVSSWCIAIGSLTRITVDPGSYSVNWALVVVATAFIVAAMISDHRVLSVHKAVRLRGAA